MVRLEEAKAQYATFQEKHARVATPEQKARVLSLAQDFPRLWNASTTRPKDRKRMIRLLIKDITVSRERGSKRVELHIRWHGGAVEHMTVTVPKRPKPSTHPQCPTDVVERVRTLCRDHYDSKTAEILNREGYLTINKRPFTGHHIQYIRSRYKLSAPQDVNELSVDAVADRLGVCSSVIYGLIKARRLSAQRRPPFRGWLIRLQPEEVPELRAFLRERRQTTQVSKDRHHSQHSRKDGAL